MQVYCDSSFDEKRQIAGIGITIIDGQKRRTFSNWIKARTKEQFINHKCCEYWAYKIRKQNVILEKIKAHQKVFQLHPMGNRMADLLANEGRAKFYERDR